MTNREIADAILLKLKEAKFTPYDVIYGDTYFIFTGEPDSVIHFRCKGVNKHWKFGMWLRADSLADAGKENVEEKTPIVRFFCQWDRNIDKFKPSASSLVIEFGPDNFDYAMEDCWDIVQLLRFIKKHPLMAYSGVGGPYSGYPAHSFLWEFISTEWYHIKKKLRKAFAISWAIPYTYLKVSLMRKSKLIKSISIYNFEKENPGWSTSHLYEIRTVFSKDATDEQIIKFMSRWCKKDRYGKFGYYDYVVSVDSCSQEGKKGYFSVR